MSLTPNCGTSSHNATAINEEPRFAEHECTSTKNKDPSDGFSIRAETISIGFRYLMEVIALNRTEKVVLSGK
jgi:hypothetical protein